MRAKIQGIYQIRNKINNKVYIGQSTDIYSRWADHRVRLNSNTHDNEHLQNAWNVYGKDAFEFSILEECENDFDVLNKLEIKWIKLKDALNRDVGYNIASGGGNSWSCAGKTESEIKEIYKKIVSARLKKWMRSGNPRKGSHISDEQKEYLSRINKGEKHPMYGMKRPEHGKKVKGENNPRALKIICLDTGEIFNCAKDAAEKYGVTNSTILKTCKGIQKKSAGMSWKYYEEGNQL